MEQRCTCGALLPPDARFCHKCGKPQYEEDIERFAALEAEATPVRAQVVEASELPADAGIGNIKAVVISMIAAVVGLIGMVLVAQISPAIIPLILCATGFAAARLYGNRHSLSALSGALLGTMTGMWLFILLAIFASSFGGWLSSAQAQEALKDKVSPAVVEETMRVLRDPHEMFTKILLPLFFVVLTSSAFGGLLAARLRRSNR